MISSLTAFSQKGTDTLPSKTFSIPVVKQIVKDLLSGDSAKAQLNIVNKQLIENTKIIQLKDSTIQKLNVKISGYEDIVKMERDKYKIVETELKSTEKKLKKEKTKNKILGSLTTVSVLFIGALLITN